jgi:hypothetical protein
MTDSSDALQWRDRVEVAYKEGFEDGDAHGYLRNKYPPCDVAWLLSDIRGDLVSPMSTEEEAFIQRWVDADYDERVSGVWRQDR